MNITETPKGLSTRLSKNLLSQWEDKDIVELIIEYYKIFDKAGSKTGGISQSLGEVTEVKKYLNGKKFKKFVEIGVNYGGSLWLYGNLFCNSNSDVIGIDISKTKCSNNIVDRLSEKLNSIKYIRKNCFDYVEEIEDNSIDLLHIDADHEYESVKKYFNTYYPKVMPGGIILIHDTNGHLGSKQFSEELHKKFNCKTFIANWLISGNYDECPDIVKPGITLIHKEKNR